MQYSHFLQILLSYKKFIEDISKLYDMGFNLMDGKYELTKPIELMLQSSIESHYGNEGWEWVSWFVYDSNFGEKDFSTIPTLIKKEDETTEMVESSTFGAQDENGNPICYSFESLWEYLEKEHKNKL
jgi:hypothetical protein